MRTYADERMAHRFQYMRSMILSMYLCNFWISSIGYWSALVERFPADWVGFTGITIKQLQTHSPPPIRPHEHSHMWILSVCFAVLYAISSMSGSHATWHVRKQHTAPKQEPHIIYIYYFEYTRIHTHIIQSTNDWLFAIHHCVIHRVVRISISFVIVACCCKHTNKTRIFVFFFF